MILKRLICLVSLILTVQAYPVAASEPSHVYQYYLNEGIKAFERHNDEEASRYLTWARELDPSSREPDQYLKALSERQRFESEAADSSRVYFPYFEEMLEKGKAALERKDYGSAKQYFYTAHLLNRNAPQPLEYLNLVKRSQEDRVVFVDRSKVIAQALDQVQPSQVTVSPKKVISPRTVAPVARKALDAQSVPVLEEALPVRVAGVKPAKSQIDVISLDEIMQNAHNGRVVIKLDLWSSLIIEGKNIQKFLIVDQGFFTAKIITRDQVQVDAQKRGSTFLHIWDDAGRRTIYIEIVFPKSMEGDAAPSVAAVEHAQPFRVYYANEWGSYYTGNDIPGMKRKSLTYQQNFGVEGQSPYGFFDTAGTTVGLDPIMHFSTYTAGLSNIPLQGVTNFNLRVFDAARNLSPLTLPRTYLRGVFADVGIFDNTIGLSASHGKELGIFGYFSQGGTVVRNAYVDAGQISLFPGDREKHYALNYVRGYGPEHGASMADQVVSIEGRHTFDQLTLSGELARDKAHNASLAGMQWGNGVFQTGLNTRKINREFTTPISAPSNQGETGVTWVTNTDLEKVRANTFVDVYENHLNPNPNDPKALNYDTSAHVNVPMGEAYALDTNVHYLDMLGDLSPRRYASGDMRLTRSYGVWGGRKGAVYLGNSYQRSRFAFVPTGEYDRYGVITGLQIPLTGSLSYYANYEYSWLREPSSDERYNPNVLSTGLSYNKAFTQKLSGNFSLAYRNEEGLGGNNSFLAGEDSISGGAGISYNATRDVNLFLDTRLRNVWAQIADNASYNDLDLRMGLRANWGSPLYWDPEGTIEGIVFKDKNNNAKYDKEEEGIVGVKVKVGDQEALTDPKGWYHLKIKAKKVLVTPVLESVPPGFIFSTPTFAKVEIRQGLRDRADFGLTSQSGIFGILFVDHNANGIPDQGDDFKGRAKLILDGKVIEVSDAQGTYFFKDVSPGKHKLTIDMPSLPAELIPLVKLQNEIVVTEGTTYIFHIPMKIKEPQPTAP
jgi:hypothetical protein